MNQAAFEGTQELLNEAGFVVNNAHYDEQSFGSWVIEIKLRPELRVVWDGKDGWVSIQRITSQIINGLPVYDDLWVGRHKFEHDPGHIVNKLRGFIS